ncbi:hypothetical protein EVAR_68295_1 [Eumeta japonica]|uniref:Uncharacterized protein n=1 Tax=Eumeta variegata TaxID=151549 RepID=A0A4C2A962_EUMVA|nr:hypothetical protein EVAR_68295_1 [Eumeta japonica]
MILRLSFATLKGSGHAYACTGDVSARSRTAAPALFAETTSGTNAVYFQRRHAALHKHFHRLRVDYLLLKSIVSQLKATRKSTKHEKPQEARTNCNASSVPQPTARAHSITARNEFLAVPMLSVAYLICTERGVDSHTIEVK